MLVTPHVISRQWLGPLKGFTAHEAIRILNLPQGTRFWQPESFDRLIRDETGYRRVRHYIEWNPVKAGLAQSPEDFPFSSATPGISQAAGRRPDPPGDKIVLC
jgi:hypothetical protein